MPRYDSRRTELFFDAQQLVVLRDAIGAARRTGLDLACVGGHREVGNESIFRFTRPMGHDAGVVGARCQAHRFQRLGQTANLIDLDQNGVRDSAIDARAAAAEN